MALSIYNAPFPFTLIDMTMTLLSTAAMGAFTAYRATYAYYYPNDVNVGYKGVIAIGTAGLLCQLCAYNLAVIYRQRVDGRPDVNSKYHTASGRWVGERENNE